MDFYIIDPFEPIILANNYSTNTHTFYNMNRIQIQYYISMQRQLQILKNMKKLELSNEKEKSDVEFI